jgi:CheY-like chemotaxis protein
MRILLVDDHPDLRRALVRRLRGAGVQVVEAADGREALALVEADGRFDAVVTDLEMPGLNGRDLVRALPPHLVARTILMTGGARSDALSAWADAFPRRLDKPFSVDALLDVLHGLEGQAGGA